MQLGYTVLFVPAVSEAVEFYERAFGLERGFVTPDFATMRTGQTTLSFGAESNERRELGEATGFRHNRPDLEPAGIQISFISSDLAQAFERAVKAGAQAVVEPQLMPWGQWVSRVRDLNGVLVSIVTAPKF